MRETLAGLIIGLILWAVLMPEDVGKWFGKVSGSYFITSMDLMLGEPKK